MTLADQFDALDLNAINEFLARGQEEHVSLEFKLINDPDLANRDDRRNFATLMSGFANSSGGLIVWGIEARKNAQDIDCAVGARHIDRLARFITRLNELTGEATKPQIEGVRHKPILDGNDRGFALTLVPESESGPYMAKLGEDRYYKRSGDAFYRMEHFDLEDMFGRRKKPKLDLTARMVGQGARTAIILGIENTGRATAKAPYLAFNITAPFAPSMFGLDGNTNNGLPKLHFGQRLKYRYGASGDFVIHSNTIHEVTALNVGMNPQPDAIPDRDIIVDYEISAEDSQMVKGTRNLGRVPLA